MEIHDDPVFHTEPLFTTVNLTHEAQRHARVLALEHIKRETVFQQRLSEAQKDIARVRLEVENQKSANATKRGQIAAAAELPAEVGRKRERVEFVTTGRDKTRRERLIALIRRMKEDIRFRKHGVREMRQICERKSRIIFAVESGVYTTPPTKFRERPSSITDVNVCRAEVRTEISKWMGIHSDQPVDVALKQWREKLTAALKDVDDDDSFCWQLLELSKTVSFSYFSQLMSHWCFSK
jgi:hypothetical protein